MNKPEHAISIYSPEVYEALKNILQIFENPIPDMVSYVKLSCGCCGYGIDTLVDIADVQSGESRITFTGRKQDGGCIEIGVVNMGNDGSAACRSVGRWW